MRHVCGQCGESYATAGACPRDGGAIVATDDPLIGSTIDRWRIARCLGAGGFGRVYRAVQPAIGGRVAIKVLSRSAADDRELLARFFAEAQTVNLIRHDSIAKVLDLATLPDGRPYIVMEYIDGAPLSAVLRRIGPLPLGSLARLGSEVLGALGAAHAAGVVHRDVKPDNILVTPSGRPIVVDFGLAKLAPDLDGRTSATRTGLLLGTPRYLSPEQAGARPVDARSDLYSVGVVLFEAATGAPPFPNGPLYQVLRMHLELPPPSPRALRPDLPEGMEAVILRALAKAPEARFASAREMAAALVASSAGLPPSAWVSLGASGLLAAVPEPTAADARRDETGQTRGPGDAPAAGPPGAGDAARTAIERATPGAGRAAAAERATAVERTPAGALATGVERSAATVAGRHAGGGPLDADGTRLERRPAGPSGATRRASRGRAAILVATVFLGGLAVTVGLLAATTRGRSGPRAGAASSGTGPGRAPSGTGPGSAPGPAAATTTAPGADAGPAASALASAPSVGPAERSAAGVTAPSTTPKTGAPRPDGGGGADFAATEPAASPPSDAASDPARAEAGASAGPGAPSSSGGAAEPGGAARAGALAVVARDERLLSLLAAATRLAHQAPGLGFSDVVVRTIEPDGRVARAEGSVVVAFRHVRSGACVRYTSDGRGGVRPSADTGAGCTHGGHWPRCSPSWARGQALGLALGQALGSAGATEIGDLVYRNGAWRVKVDGQLKIVTERCPPRKIAAPPAGPRGFDVLGFLPRARDLATERLGGPATLTGLLFHVADDGAVDDRARKVRYGFIRKRADGPGECTDVLIRDGVATVTPVEKNCTTYSLRAAPRCHPGVAFARALADGAPGGLDASVQYLGHRGADEWSVQLDKWTGYFPDDCAGPAVPEP